MRLRRRAAGLVVGAGVLFFLGTNVQAGWLFVLSATLLGAVIAGIAMPARATAAITIARSAPRWVHQGEEVLVGLAVQGCGRGTRRGLLVHDPFLDDTDVWVGSVAAGERVEVQTTRVARRRGLSASGGVSLRSAAPFGVAERRRTVPIEGAGTIVLPTVEPIGPLPFVRPASTSANGMHTAPRRGQGAEYLGVREYRPGDSMRLVHWRSTARTGVMMVRELELEQTRRLVIAIDASRDDDRPAAGPTPLDRVCSAAASIALAALAQGHGARLVSGRHGDMEVLARASELELLEHLALVAPDPGAGSFPELVRTMAGALRGVETAVLAFPTWVGNDAERLAPAVEALAASVPTVVALPVVLGGNASLRDRDLDGLAQRLRAVGAAVHPLRTGVALADALGADAPGLRRP